MREVPIGYKQESLKKKKMSYVGHLMRGPSGDSWRVPAEHSGEKIAG